MQKFIFSNGLKFEVFLERKRLKKEVNLFIKLNMYGDIDPCLNSVEDKDKHSRLWSSPRRHMA